MEIKGLKGTVQGPRPTATDSKILVAVALDSTPATTARRISTEIDLSTRQLRDRLDSLADDNYLGMFRAGPSKVYYLRDRGRDHLGMVVGDYV